MSTSHRVITVGKMMVRILLRRGGLADDGLEQAGRHRPDPGDHHHPAQPARVLPAPGHRQPVEDEGHAGEQDVEQGGQGEVEGFGGQDQPQGGRPLIGRRGRPRLGELLGRDPVEGDEDQPDGDAGDGGSGPQPGQGAREPALDRLGHGQQAAEHEHQADHDREVAGDPDPAAGDGGGHPLRVADGGRGVDEVADHPQQRAGDAGGRPDPEDPARGCRLRGCRPRRRHGSAFRSTNLVSVKIGTPGESCQ